MKMWFFTDFQEFKSHLPNVMKLVRDSTVTGPLPQKYWPRSRIWFVPSSRTRNCSVRQVSPSPCSHLFVFCWGRKKIEKWFLNICTNKKTITTISSNPIWLPWPQHWCGNKAESHNCVGIRWNSGTMSPDHRNPSIRNSPKCWCIRPDWSLMYLRLHPSAHSSHNCWNTHFERLLASTQSQIRHTKSPKLFQNVKRLQLIEFIHQNEFKLKTKRKLRESVRFCLVWDAGRIIGMLFSYIPHAIDLYLLFSDKKME